MFIKDAEELKYLISSYFYEMQSKQSYLRALSMSIKYAEEWINQISSNNNEM